VLQRSGSQAQNQIGFVVTEHSRNPDAYDSLKLRKASASEAEQQGKDFAKDLGVNRKEMEKVAFSATRSIYGVVMLAAISVFGVMLIALALSWNNNRTTKRDGYVPSSLHGALSDEFCCCHFLSLGRGTATRSY
jgi:hypothetical protein